MHLGGVGCWSRSAPAQPLLAASPAWALQWHDLAERWLPLAILVFFLWQDGHGTWIFQEVPYQNRLQKKEPHRPVTMEEIEKVIKKLPSPPKHQAQMVLQVENILREEESS